MESIIVDRCCRLGLLAGGSGAILSFLLTFATSEESKREELTATQILGRMATVYAQCKSYRDSGVLKTVFIDDTGKRIDERRFTTAFIRPHRFRFEYELIRPAQQSRYRYIIWSNGRDVRTWWYVVQEIRQAESLGSALTAAAGVSGGLTMNIPALLLPDAVGIRFKRDLVKLSDSERVEDGKLGKVDCFRVQGNYLDDRTVLWIDKATFLLHRIDRHSNVADGVRTEVTVTYNPAVDCNISERQLEFDPPQEE